MVKSKSKRTVPVSPKPDPEKYAVMHENPQNRRHLPIVWKFNKMNLNPIRKWDWFSKEQVILNSIFKKLGQIESNTFHELLQSKPHHYIPISELRKVAQHELEKLQIRGHESIFSIRITGPKRVFCLCDANEMSLLWLDLNHEVSDYKR